jgi:hypothetical protein
MIKRKGSELIAKTENAQSHTIIQNTFFRNRKIFYGILLVIYNKAELFLKNLSKISN